MDCTKTLKNSHSDKGGLEVAQWVLNRESVYKKKLTTEQRMDMVHRSYAYQVVANRWESNWRKNYECT